MPVPDVSGRPDAASVGAALRSVDGVAQAQVIGAIAEGSAILRLTLTRGADEVAVATAVDKVLRRGFRLRLDPSRIELVEESEPVAPVRDASAGSPRVASSSDHLSARAPTASEPAGAARASATAQSEPARAASTGAAASEPAANGPTPAVQAQRPVIVRAVVSSDGDRVSSEVVLRWRGYEHSGVAAIAGSAVHRAVVLSTLRALRSILGPGSPVQLTVVGLVVQALDDSTVALVRLRLRTTTGTEWLVGAAEVHADAAQSLVRATLDAVNRRLTPLFGTG